jgi:hypothetical protein
MYNQLEGPYKQQLDTLMNFIRSRDFIKAEKLVLALVETVLTHGIQDKDQVVADLNMLSILYQQFNKVYLAWINIHDRQHADSEYKELFSEEHDNCLIAHCSLIAEMDDLLYETMQYVMDKSEQEEVERHLNCYKKLTRRQIPMQSYQSI